MDISNAMLDLISESLEHPGPGHGIIMRPARATAADHDACSAAPAAALGSAAAELESLSQP